MKITVDVTNPEIEAMEDFLQCWNVCKKHQRDAKTEHDFFAAIETCKACKKVEKNLHDKALHLWSKLAHQYEIARTGKCVHLRRQKPL